MSNLVKNKVIRSDTVIGKSLSQNVFRDKVNAYNAK